MTINVVAITAPAPCWNPRSRRLWRSNMTSALTPRFVSGYSSARLAVMTSISARAASIVVPSASRPMSSSQ